MRCENCGAELANGTRFCTSCGKEVAPYAAQEVITADQPRTDYSQQYNYVPPQQQQYYPQPAMDPPLSVGQYIGMFLLMMIPVVNLVLLLVWAFGGSVNR
ncbi:MAG: zinc ribbon domain-containing protein, partial [Clostridiaceae bacterium]|nr:zinc ribbon domain-containing protein [Clostridiaceae bacterium]